MTITSAHALYSSTTTGGSSLSVTATAVNDLWVVYVGIGSNTVTCTGVSGGHATGWTNAVANWVDTFGITQSLWIGNMTSTGATTITCTFSGSVSGLTVDIDAQPFHSSLSSPSWAVDAVGHQNNTASTTVTWPTLTPTAGLTDLYWGRAGTNGTGSSPTSGYTLATDADGNLVIYNPGVSTSQSPTCTQTSSKSAASAVLISEAPAVTASAGLASAVAHAWGPSMASAAGAGSAHATGAVPATGGGVSVNAALAQASGAAFSARGGVGGNAGLAQAAVAAFGSTIAAATGAGLAHAGGSPQQVTAVPLVPALDRTGVVVFESRNVRVAAETRYAVVPPEIRTVKVPQQGG